MPTHIHWFRRDLRLANNPALSAAARESGGAVIPVFILDHALLRPEKAAPARVQFLLESLAALDAALRQRGSALVVRQGDPASALAQLAAEHHASAVFFNRDYTPYARSRDTCVAQVLGERGIPARSFADQGLIEPDDLLTKGGTPYTVFTPYYRQWRPQAEHGLAAPLPAPTALAAPPPGCDPGHLPTLAELGHAPVALPTRGGEDAALAQLAHFTDLDNPRGIAHYASQRDTLALPATSQLSAHLHMGCVDGPTCMRAALEAAQRAAPDAAQQIESWVRQLAWRDFYTQILWHHPHVRRGAFRRQYDAIVWENSPQLFQAWCEGLTGYPIVDAAMRQLRDESWMHNRARMIAASFLVKDLLIDWRWGEAFFFRHLLDGDLANNNGGWQWAAGTGTDAQPYFRIFNPTSQGQKFDPDGAYVRRHVPELASLPSAYIHQPWATPPALARELGFQIGKTYPAPVVDHAAQRPRAIALYHVTGDQNSHEL